ncbi:hypothetical protein L218DRAFT_956263 [Marasmius fiardii PR-910]|nr:hypothetical protein L218DRAFT_956263 [Marasmius fiardii PR-910]
MAVFTHRYHHWAYVWIPLFGAFIWFGTLWAMLITWLAQGRPRYETIDGTIAYISDIGADFLKPLFVAGCSITAVSFFLSLVIERYLRHSGRLHPNMRTRERITSTLAALGALIGGAGLVLLSVFDTKRHSNLHRLFLLIFMIGVALSALFTVMEYRWLSRDFWDAKELRFAYKTKAFIAGILIVLAVAFGITLFNAKDAGAVLEWTIAFGFTFYLLTFFMDLREAKGIHKGELSRSRMTELGYGARV